MVVTAQVLQWALNRLPDFWTYKSDICVVPVYSVNNDIGQSLPNESMPLNEMVFVKSHEKGEWFLKTIISDGKTIQL